MRWKRPKVSVLTYSIFMAGFFFFIINYSFLEKFYNYSPLLKTNHLLFSLSFPFVVFLILFLIFFLTAFQNFTRIFAIVAIWVSCFVSYSILIYNISFNADAIRSIIETNSNEMAAYFAPEAILYFFAVTVLPIAVLSFIKIDYPNPKVLWKQKAIALGACLSISGVLYFFQSPEVRQVFKEQKPMIATITPLNYINGVARYIYEISFRNSHPFEKLGLDAELASSVKKSKKNTMVVFIVGETARAKSFPINNEDRKKNSKLTQHKVVSFTNVASCGTVTAISIPCIFSNLEKKDFSVERAEARENLLDIAKRAGYHVKWFDNNGGSKLVAKRVSEVSTQSKKYCELDYCLDDVLLKALKHEKKKFQRDSRPQFIILHQLGSHGPRYYERYTDEFRVFTPDCRDPTLKTCSSEEIINAYDNSIGFTENNIHEVIQFLHSIQKYYNTAMIYVSDHGESTGEYGFYLHGIPYAIAPEEQKHVPWISWFSKDFQSAYNIDQSCLNRVKDLPYSHDNIFHSMLGILNIETEIYQKDLDVFQQCRPKWNGHQQNPGKSKSISTNASSS